MNESEFWNRANEIAREGRNEAREYNYEPDYRPDPKEL